jgi:hypothetical protein
MAHSHIFSRQSSVDVRDIVNVESFSSESAPLAGTDRLDSYFRQQMRRGSPRIG